MTDDSLLVQHLETQVKHLQDENSLLLDKNKELRDKNNELHTELIRVAHFRNLLKTLRLVIKED